MNLAFALSIVIGVVIVLAAHFVPKFVAEKFGPGRGLAVGGVGLALLLGAVFKAGGPGLFDGLALALLVRGVVTHYRGYDEVRMEERGEAAIAAAEGRE